MQPKIIRTLTAGIFTCFFFLLVSCRYKDNTLPSALTVKKRLTGVWHLKAAKRADQDLVRDFPDIYNEKLEFSEFNGDAFTLYSPVNGIGCLLKNNKTAIYINTPDVSYNYHLTITKLTKDELWLEGNPLIGICRYAAVVQDNLELRYEK